jgi:hypothetical protein
MNNLKEISDFIDTIPLGNAIYNIKNSYGDELSIKMQNWHEKEDLLASDNWLKYQIGRSISRKFDKDLNKMVLCSKNDAIDEVKYSIYNFCQVLARKTSPAEQPKRTKAYKDFVDISYYNRNNDNFINDLIPIVNYYKTHVESTDSTNREVHKKNIFGLLNILRKKYAKSSTSN